MTVKWIAAGKGIRYREHDTRKHGVRPDRYWCIQYRRNNKTYNEAIGWWSEGANQAECERALAKLRENWRIGQGPQSLKEMRQANQADREKERQALEKAELAGTTLEDFWATKYFPRASLSKAKHSIDTEAMLFRVWLAPLAACPLEDINPLLIEEAVVQPMMKAQKSARTIQYALAVLSQIWNAARDLGLLTGDSPMKKVKRPKKDNKRVRFLTEKEAVALLAGIRARSQDVHDLSLLSLFCGLRAGEGQALTWADVNFDEKLLFIKDTKNELDRHAHMTIEIEEMLGRRYNGQPKTELVIPSCRGGESRWRITSTFTRTVEALGFNRDIIDSRQKVVFHTLRHTFASWLVQRGVPIYSVSQLMGHKSIQMTMRYAHLAPNTQKAAAMMLEGALSQGQGINT